MNRLASTFESLSKDLRNSLSEQLRFALIFGAAVGVFFGAAVVAAVLAHLWALLFVPALCVGVLVFFYQEA